MNPVLNSSNLCGRSLSVKLSKLDLGSKYSKTWKAKLDKSVSSSFIKFFIPSRHIFSLHSL